MSKIICRFGRCFDAYSNRYKLGKRLDINNIVDQIEYDLVLNEFNN